MRLPEYDSLDATAMAALVARGEVTPSELLEAALERADLRNPPINAIVRRYDDEARARAKGPLPAGPFTGVPFLLKDILAAWRGHPLASGSRLLEGWIPDYDSEVVQRFQRAGFVLFGITNAPELGLLAHTESRLYGPARNPWNLGRTPGGSSGGAAAAIAARIVPAAHASDGGGSIRIPASHCGLFGLKASRGLVNLAPDRESWMGFVCGGALSRSVRDAAAIYDLLSGHAPGSPYAAPPQARPFTAELGVPPGRLRIAFTDRAFFGHATHPECSAAMRGAAKLLADLGHEVEEAAPPMDRDAMVRAYLYAVAACTAAEVDRGVARTGRRPGPATLEDETLALAAAGRAVSGGELVLANEAMHAMARDVEAFLERYDLLLTPTVAQPPVPIGSLQPKPWERVAIRIAAATRSRWLIDRLFEDVGDRSFDATGFTMPFNQTGQPAMSVPLHTTADGLPIGVQFVARFGDEATLFRLASQLEAARPWADRSPPGPAGR